MTSSPATQAEVAPAHRLITLPAGVPDLTLGWEAAGWAGSYLLHPNGLRARLPWEFVGSQMRFLLWWYAVDDAGQWLFRSSIRRLAKGSGKAETLTAVIPTPAGWTTVGEIQPGDELFGADGSVITCVQVHPVLLGEDTYRVTLSDGTAADFSGGHLFAVDVFVGGSKRLRKTLSVAEMAAEGLTYVRALTAGKTKCRTGGVARYALPASPVLDGRESDLPMDPYVLGVWLGDGDSDCPRITAGGEDLPHMLGQLESRGIEHGAPKRTNTAWRVRFGRGWATGVLRGLGVLGAKHIPQAYLRGSVSQRLELLRGLMDTDGTIGPSGSAEFSVTSRVLAFGTAELIRTLGMKVRVREDAATLRGRVVGRRYRLMFKPYAEQPVFTLPRKVARLRSRTYSSAPRTVRSIERVASRPMRCITVSAPDGLYLSGETMWVTHNSPFAAVLSLIELCAPVRLDDFDASRPGGVRGRPVDMPLVQIAATAESQTANTMRMVRALAAKGSRVVAAYGLDPGKTVYYKPGGGELRVITSSVSAAEGAEATCVIADETEHWLPGNSGPELAATLEDNLAKSGNRMLQTCNAWKPGAGSVAEASWDAWVAQEEGRTRGDTRILYDARVAAPDTDLADDESLTRALVAVYGDCWWQTKNLAAVKERIWDPRAQPDDSRRKYLNQPTAALDAWVTPQQWAANADPSVVVADAEDVALFFDGSRSRDATALLGCRMSDGFGFTVGVWEPAVAHDRRSVVPVDAVDAAVARAMDRWTVWAFLADVNEWDGFVKVTWPGRYGEQLKVWSARSGSDPQPIAWDMRTHVRDFTLACELTEAEIREGHFRHDGDARVARHVGNARRRPNRWGVSIGKESKDSPDKIDAAVCVVGSRLARRLVLASREWQQRRPARQAPRRIR